MEHRLRKAFNLVELLVTMTITLMVMAGLMFTFTRITRTTKDASKANDMTQEGFGVHQVMSLDFSNAGLGISDISMLELHYNFNPAFHTQTPGRHFFPIDDLQITGGFSDITLHRFDYDLVNGNSPTALAGLENGDSWTGFAGIYPYVNAVSNDSSVLTGIEQGDIFAVYRLGMIRSDNGQAFTRPESPWHTMNVVDPMTGDPKNEAILLEAVAVQAMIDHGAGTGMQFKRKVEFGVGSFFSNDLNPNPIAIPGDASPGGITSSQSVRNDPVLHVRHPTHNSLPSINENLTFIRKLGNARSFHRVRYFVQNLGGRNVLTRSDNGVEEIMATNVTHFEVKVGIDIPIGTMPDQVMSDQMDGYVSVREPSQWIGSLGELGMSDRNNEKIMGRHAVAVRVRLEFEAHQKDISTDTSQVKKRSFEQVYRLPSTVPFPIH